MIKPLDTHGRPQCDDTQFIIDLFKVRKTVSRKLIVHILGCEDSTHNRIKYLKSKGFIKKIGRGLWCIS